MRFKFIDAAKENFPITRLCQVLNISPSGYFAWRSRPASPCQQYCLIEYRAELRKHGIQISVSGKGNRFDNAVVETFFKNLKSELVWRTVFRTRAKAREAIGRYFGGFYNPVRRHSTLDDLSPVQFERLAA